MLVRLLRAADDQVGLAEARAAASHSLENAMRRMRKDIRRQRRSYYDSYDCEAEAAKLALLAADLGRPAYAADAVDLMNAWASQAEMASASWDAFRGYFPRSDEMRQDSDNQYTRRSHLVAHLAEAFHRAGDAEQAATWFQRAREFADGVRTPGRRARAFVALAEIAARCGWFATMQAVLPEATAVRGTELGSVAEILAVTVRQGRTDADGARDALDTLLLSKTLTNLDHLDILSQLAVLSLDPAVEVQLLAASTEAPAVPSDG
jgi:hypothetical protein